MIIVLILTAYKWLPPFAADVKINDVAVVKQALTDLGKISVRHPVLNLTILT